MMKRHIVGGLFSAVIEDWRKVLSFDVVNFSSSLPFAVFVSRYLRKAFFSSSSWLPCVVASSSRVASLARKSFFTCWNCSTCWSVWCGWANVEASLSSNLSKRSCSGRVDCFTNFWSCDSKTLLVCICSYTFSLKHLARLPVWVPVTNPKSILETVRISEIGTLSLQLFQELRSWWWGEHITHTLRDRWLFIMWNRAITFRGGYNTCVVLLLF